MAHEVTTPALISSLSTSDGKVRRSLLIRERASNCTAVKFTYSCLGPLSQGLNTFEPMVPDGILSLSCSCGILRTPVNLGRGIFKGLQ